MTVRLLPTFRALEDGDEEQLIALWLSCDLIAPYNEPKRDISLWRASPNSEILVAEHGGRLIASVCVGHDGHRGWLYYVAVHADSRGQGFGRQLVRQAEDWLSARGILKAELMVRGCNKAVGRFYSKIGYAQEDRIVLTRWLTPDNGPPTEDYHASEMIDVTITYLEMDTKASLPPAPPPAGRSLALLRAERPSLTFYRFLYDNVGWPWLWWERRAKSNARLKVIVEDPNVEISVLYADGQPAGFFELDRRFPPDIELAYFGLLPEFIGQRLGPYLLHCAIDAAWRHEPVRVTVNTNTLDHPKALPLYQKFGFTPVRQETRRIRDPRRIGLIPPKASRDT